MQCKSVIFFFGKLLLVRILIALSISFIDEAPVESIKSSFNFEK